MTTPVALADLKAHLRLDEGATDEDGYLEARLLPAAIRAVELHTQRTIGGDAPTLAGADLAVANLAILLVAGLWYEQREIGTPLTREARWMLEPLVRWTDE